MYRREELLTMPSDGKRKILVFASGTRTGGGSGFEWLVEATRTGVIPNAEVVAVVSNVRDGGVNARAGRLKIPFCWTGWVREQIDRMPHRTYVKMCNPDLTCLSGWLWPLEDPDTTKVINIHPALCPSSAAPVCTATTFTKP